MIFYEHVLSKDKEFDVPTQVLKLYIFFLYWGIISLILFVNFSSGHF